jgi:hypothetical protein
MEIYVTVQGIGVCNGTDYSESSFTKKAARGKEAFKRCRASRASEEVVERVLGRARSMSRDHNPSFVICNLK